MPAGEESDELIGATPRPAAAIVGEVRTCQTEGSSGIEVYLTSRCDLREACHLLLVHPPRYYQLPPFPEYSRFLTSLTPLSQALARSGGRFGPLTPRGAKGRAGAGLLEDEDGDETNEGSTLLEDYEMEDPRPEDLDYFNLKVGVKREEWTASGGVRWGGGLTTDLRVVMVDVDSSSQVVFEKNKTGFEDTKEYR